MREQIYGEGQCAWCCGRIEQPRFGRRVYCEGTSCKDDMEAVRKADRVLRARPARIAAAQESWQGEEVKGVHNGIVPYHEVVRLGRITFGGEVVKEDGNEEN